MLGFVFVREHCHSLQGREEPATLSIPGGKRRFRQQWRKDDSENRKTTSVLLRDFVYRVDFYTAGSDHLKILTDRLAVTQWYGFGIEYRFTESLILVRSLAIIAMSFAAPIALILAALAVPIIALYILKVRLRRIPVSTNMFWKQVYDEKPPRSLWQNLRHWLSLLAQLLLLGLLVLAIADPFFAWQAERARRRVIIVDASASMRASDVLPLDLKANETWSRTIEKTSLEGGELEATLTRFDQPDFLSVDNTAWAIVPPREVQNVLIVSPGNLFLQKVFEANPLVRVTLTGAIPDKWPAESIVILHRLVPEKMPKNNVFVIDPESSCDLWEVGELIDNPIVTEQDETSPLMTYIRLDNVLVPEARQIDFKIPVDSLAATVSGQPIYASLNREAAKGLVLCVNLEQSDLAFRTAFPILIANALAWFAGQAGELEPAIATGGMARVATSASDNRTLVSPTGIRSPVTGDQAGPLTEVGVWSIEGDSAGGAIAVNLANPRESDLRPVDATASEQHSAIAGLWFTRPIWFYCVAVAVLLLAVEWFLYQRRLIG